MSEFPLNSEGGVAGQEQGAPNGANLQSSQPVMSPNPNNVGMADNAPVRNVPTGYIPESDLNALRSKYDKREAELRRALDMQRAEQEHLARQHAEMQAQMLQFQISQLPRAQQVEALQRLEGLKQVVALKSWKDNLEAQIADERAKFEPIARREVINTLSTMYEVPKEYLEDINDPVAMEAAAQKLSVVLRQVKLNQRADARLDATEPGTVSPSSVTPDYDPRKFRNTGSVAAALKAKRQAGLF